MSDTEDEGREPITMTPEMQDELLGLLPYETETEIRFMPPCYKRESVPVSLRPTFVLRPMSAATKTKVVGWQKNTKTLTDEAVRDLTRYHVTGWEGLTNIASSEPIPFEAAVDGGAASKLFAMLPQKPVVEILFYLCRVAGIADPDRRGFTS